MSNIFVPGPLENTVYTREGKIQPLPEDWAFLPPGDATLTRRVKKAGEHWVIQERIGRKIFTRGVCAPAATIEKILADLEAERSTETYAKRRKVAARRRENVQAAYVEDFYGAVLAFLDFDPQYAETAQKLARAVADHATPIGSGTVARTRRIPIEQRAQAAVIAWMRHQTTAYDAMRIPRREGERHEIRRMFALRSKELLDRYRRGEKIPKKCPLMKALERLG